METKLDGAGGLCPTAQLILEEPVSQENSSANSRGIGHTSAELRFSPSAALSSSLSQGEKGQARPGAISPHRSSLLLAALRTSMEGPICFGLTDFPQTHSQVACPG